MHEHKIMHRDIKPNNVVFMDGIAKFIDFGAARKLSEDEMAKTCIGTKYSQTPEILLGKEYDYKGDVFSLGVTLLEMTGVKLKSNDFKRTLDEIKEEYPNLVEIINLIIRKI